MELLIMESLPLSYYFHLINGKDKFYPRTDHEGLDGSSCIAVLFL